MILLEHLAKNSVDSILVTYEKINKMIFYMHIKC